MLVNMLLFILNLQQMGLIIFKYYLKKVSSHLRLFIFENKKLFHHESNTNHFLLLNYSVNTQPSHHFT